MFEPEKCAINLFLIRYFLIFQVLSQFVPMCDSAMMLEYGLIGSFDTVAMMSGERIAIIMKRDLKNSFFYVPESPDELIEIVSVSDNECVQNSSMDFVGDESDSDEEEEETELEGMSYSELQYFSQNLSKQLYYRFGVRTGDRVLLICQHSAAAEVVAMLACARIGATFIPIDDSWLTTGTSGLISSCRYFH